jgi:tape measure domain-containing protein
LAIVRELITLLGTEVDTAGFQQYETGIARIKEITKNLAATLGIAFSIDKIIEFADGLVDAGKEVNRLVAQLKVIARPIDDMNMASEETYNIAQRVGVAYKDVLETYKEFQNEMTETNVPQEQILKTTENIYKALRIGRASAEDMHTTMELFNRSFRRGSFRSIGIGQLHDIAPRAFKALADFYKTDEAGLRAMAKAGKVTAEDIVKAFGSANAELDAEVAKVPQKLGFVFTNIYSDLVKVTAQIYKLTEASEFMGKIVWYVWTRFTYAVKTLTDFVGGLKNMVQLLGIALAVALGPYLIRTLALATAWTIRWAIANAALLVQWLAIGAAVAAVAIGIQDLIFWMQGKESIIGTWVGPFNELSENFKKLDIFAGFRVFDDLLKGDWKAAFADVKTALTSTQAIVLELTTVVSLVFVSWRVIKFASLIASIFSVKEAVESVGIAAKKTQEAIDTAAKTKWTKPGLGKDEIQMGPGYGPRVARGGLAYGLNALNLLSMMQQQADDAAAGRKPDKPLDTMMQTDLGKRIEAGYQYYRQAAKDAILNGPAALYNRAKNGPAEIVDASKKQLQAPTAADIPPVPVTPVSPTGTIPPVPAAPTPMTDDKIPTIIVKPLNFTDWDKQPPTSVAPGAMGPTVAGPTTNNTEVKPTFNQTNNIHVETTLDAAQIGQIVGDKVGQYANTQLESFARSLGVGSPRVEAATQ